MSTVAPQTTVSDWQLLKWMLRFLKPVKWLAVLACLYLALWTGGEILTVRQTAQAVDRIGLVPVGGHTGGPGFWAWLAGHSPDATGLRQAVLLLAGFSLVMAALACLREVANMKLSMNKVFFIREAVYDKLQRVGLRFHDRISTGELINRALNDLQNVRNFVNTAVLSTLEIALIVGGYIILLLTRTPWAALLALIPLPVWIWRTLVFSRRIRPAQEAVMQSGDENVSLITENIAGVHVVKAFATENHEIDRYNRNCDEFCRRVLARSSPFGDRDRPIAGRTMSHAQNTKSFGSRRGSMKLPLLFIQ
jgi:ATP-binding cassette subfamily B protein